MRLLIITQRVDPHDAQLGFFCSWLRHLASVVEQVQVITLDRRPGSLPPNVTIYSLGKEQCVNRWQRWRQFHRLAARLVQRAEADAVFAHMCPEYVMAAAPYAWRQRVPIVWWYTHRQRTWRVQLAHRIAARVVTATEDSFPLASPKVAAIGHGIDGNLFQPSGHGDGLPADGARVILAAGRPSAVKRWDLLMRAMALLVRQRGRRDVRLVIAGCSRQDLSVLIRRSRLEPYVQCLGAVPHDEMARTYQRAHLFVNTSPPGLFDKVVLEAMACGVAPVVCNPAFASCLGSDGAGLIAPAPEPEALARTITGALDRADRDASLGGRLREAVIRQHGVDHLIPRLVETLRAGGP